MAEDFIEEIYRGSELITGYKRCIYYLQTGDYIEYSNMWRNCSNVIGDIIQEWLETDPKNANELYSFVNSVTKVGKDYSLKAELISEGIIKNLYRYMENYRGIDVTEGRWRIVSTKSGFLTLQDVNESIHLHSMDDPLDEAFVRARKIYDGRFSTVLLYGAGLGYLAYALWILSEGSIKIKVYEADSAVTDYAKLYGVADRIPEDNYEVFTGPAEELFPAYLEAKESDKNSLGIISDYMAAFHKDVFLNEFQSESDNQMARTSFRSFYEVNFWRNKPCFAGNFSDLKYDREKRDYIVIAGGPSADYCIDYLKENKGKKVIIAVTTVLKKLLSMGVKPDYLCVIDRAIGVYKHIEGVEEETYDIPLIAERVSFWKCIGCYKGPVYKIYAADFELSVSEAKQENADFWRVGSTVTNLAIEAAAHMGADSIELIGADLAFPGNKYHAGDEKTRGSNSMQDNIEVPSVDGGTVPTVDAFIRFRIDIEKQIERYKNIRFYNLSKNGALIKGAAFKDVTK